MRRKFQKAPTERLQGEPLPPWSLFGFHPGSDKRHDVSHDQGWGELARSPNMSQNMKTLNRRDFLRLSPVVLGGAMLACSKAKQHPGGSVPIGRSEKN
jgi:hypothetical protein